MKFSKYIPLMIVAVALVAYHNSFDAPFIFDDKGSTVDNPHIRQLFPLSEAMRAPDQSTAAGRPLVSLSLALNYAVSGTQVWSYHAFNLLVHILNALLLFGILRRTLPKTQNLKPKTLPLDAPRSRTFAAVIALLWVVHPMQTEAVTYIIQRTELMFAFFFLVTLYCVIRGVEQSRSGVSPLPEPPLAQPTKRRDAASTVRRGWFFAAVVSCALGMGCKEVMAVAPVIVLCFDRAYLAASWREVFQKRAALYGGLAATWLIIGYIVATGPRSDSVGFNLGFTWHEYLFAQCRVLFRYLRLSVLPHPLVVDYFEWPIGSDEWLAPWVVGAVLLGLATVWLFFRKPALGFLGVWLFVILAPTSSFVPITSEVAAERRMYLPLAAVLVVVVFGVWWLLKKVFAEREGFPELLAKVLCGAALVACLGLTILRNGDYAVEERLWLDTVENFPNNPRARNNLAVVYAERGEMDAALEQFEQALELKPYYPDGLFNYGNALARAGRLEDAVKQFRFALQLRPNMPTAHSNLGVTLANSGSLAEALTHHEHAVRLLPNAARAHFNRGETLLKMGARAEARESFTRAASLATAAETSLAEQIRKRLEELERGAERP